MGSVQQSINQELVIGGKPSALAKMFQKGLQLVQNIDDALYLLPSLEEARRGETVSLADAFSDALSDVLSDCR